MYMQPHDFFQKYPHLLRKGKLYGGAYWWPELVRRMYQVCAALSRQTKFDWTYENSSCDDYNQRTIYVAK